MQQANSNQIQTFLRGVNYPAGKQQLIDNAYSMGADEDVRSMLEQLPNQNFQTSDDVSQAIGNLSGSQGAAISSGHREFLAEALQDSLAEVELCQIALQKSSTNDVRMIARRMVTDHSLMANEIARVASSKQIQVSKDLSSDRSSRIEQLSSLSDKEFDSQFMQQIVQEHDKDVKVFRHYAESQGDSDIKALASKWGYALSQHLGMAQEVLKGLQS